MMRSVIIMAFETERYLRYNKKEELHAFKGQGNSLNSVLAVYRPVLINIFIKVEI
jgi:hypothetical protein